MIGARRQIELRHRRPHQPLTLVLQPAKLPNLPDAHVRVANDVSTVIMKSPGLDIPRGLYTSVNSRRGLP